MQTSYAELLKDLAGQYNSGRLTLEQFRALRRTLLCDAQAQYVTPPPFDGNTLAEDDSDITQVPEK